MNIALTRGAQSPAGTFGMFSIDDMPVCVTVERPWENNQSSVSCIPPGIYRFKAYFSPTKGNVWITQAVPQRSNIEIHAANIPEELEGCIGVGQFFYSLNGKKGVANSKSTLNLLRSYLPDEFDLVVR